MIIEARPDPANHWISIALEGSPKNKLALNARVRVTTSKLQQLGEVRSGGSYISQSELPLHFGLGRAERADTLEVMWPGGATQVFHDVQADHFYALKQGAAALVDKGKAVPRPVVK
jgi:hypothetical protein